MELLRYTITPEGTLGAPYVEKKPKQEKKEVVIGGALASLLEDDDEDWGGDAPDMRAEFARIGHLHEEEDEDTLPLTADFAANSDGTLALVRWPRLARPAVIPAQVEGKTVTAVAATAFAASHLEESCFAQFTQSPISYSVFCMRMGRHLTTETVDEGGPTQVSLPDTLTHIGPYAFWHCDNLTAVRIPDGVTRLPAGVFGDCARLAQVHLPAGLTAVGYLPRPTDQVMPDVGVFAGCHSLKQITFPAGLTELGAHSFNSSALVSLTAVDNGSADQWSRPVTVDPTAFDHTAALLWLEKQAPDGSVLYRLGLPAAREKILAGDRKFGGILRIPVDFFSHGPAFFDAMAQNAFRLDFSARMALSRLQLPGGLSGADADWYRNLLVRYFDHAPQFMPGEKGEAAYAALFDFLNGLSHLTASDMSDILRVAGPLGLSADLLARMMETRTRRFATVTGFEDLDLDDL